jgi:hypothetical protein
MLPTDVIIIIYLLSLDYVCTVDCAWLILAKGLNCRLRLANTGNGAELQTAQVYYWERG